MKCSRRIRPIVSTISIPHRPLHAKAGSRTNRKFGGQSSTPIPRLRGSFFHAGSQARDRYGHLVEMPLQRRPRASTAKISSEQWPELQHPPSHRFVGHIEPTLSEQIFDV